MKPHTTNYFDTFIGVAEDCPLPVAEVPPPKEPKTAVRVEYEMAVNSPYTYTSDDIVYESNGRRKGISWEAFFSKGQPCLRSSALGKRYGWGIHCNNAGGVAIYAVESAEYKRLSSDESLRHLKAMRSGKKQP